VEVSMSGLNLGKLMQEAGVKGAKPSSSPPTLEELKALSRKTPPQQAPEKVAMDRLPAPFQKLRDPSQIKDGKEFMDELCKLFRRAKSNSIDGEVLSEHTIIGICQLAHWHRDRTDISPSRKKSFNKVILSLLKWRDKIQKKPPKDIAEFVNEKLDELGDWRAFY
jgi:hypothetical protein